MYIKEAIVHRVDKERQKNCKLVLRDQCLQVEEVLADAVEKVRKTYGTTASRAYGTFEADILIHPFNGMLSEYLQGNMTMVEFSSAAVKLLSKEMDNQPLATGGYAFFVNYEENAKNFVMVILLKLRGGVGIDEKNLSLSKNFNLDVDHLHEAARVNVDNWNSNEGNYISFVKKGRSDQDFTDYFRKFLGCAEFVESKTQTEKIVQVIRDYCNESNFIPDEVKKIKEKAFSYFSEQARDGKGVSLVALSMRFDDENPKAFLEYIDKSSVELSDGFEPHKSSFRKLMRVGGKDADITINFDIGLLGNRVRYDPIKKELLIVNLPPTLIAQIEAEI